MYSASKTIIVVLVSAIFVLLSFYVFRREISKLQNESILNLLVYALMGGLVRSLEDVGFFPNSFLFKTPTLWIILSLIYLTFLKLDKSKYILPLSLIIITALLSLNIFRLNTDALLSLILFLLPLFIVSLVFFFFKKISLKNTIILFFSFMDLVTSIYSQIVLGFFESHYFQRLVIGMTSSSFSLILFKVFSLSSFFLIILFIKDKNLKSLFITIYMSISVVVSFRNFFTALFF